MSCSLIHFACSIAAAYIVAVAVWPLLKYGVKCNLVATGLAIIGISASPALIPPEGTVARAFSCLMCIDPVFRVFDYSRQLRKGSIEPVTWQSYCLFLIPFPFLLTVFGQKQQTMQTPQFNGVEFLRLAISLATMATALFLCLQSHLVSALRESFLLDHLVKMMLFITFAEAASQLQIALERVIGFRAPPLINHSYLALTPGEFWFRYNQRVRQWLYENVFVPCGGRKSPPAGVTAVFLVSAIFHEFFFALATSRLDGYQFAFFILQAPAVIVSRRLVRLARRRNGGQFAVRGLTLLWFAGTTPLFFHGLDRIFPFYYASQPLLP